MQAQTSLNEALNVIGNLQQMLGNVDLTELKASANIKAKIAELEKEMEEEVRDHEIFTNQDMDTTPEKILKDGFDEDDIFRDAMEAIAYGGNIQNLDLMSVETLINDINDLARVITRYEREIRDLKNLLK